MARTTNKDQSQGGELPDKVAKTARSVPKKRANQTVKALNPKEIRFRDEYLLSLDPKQAALAAGYSPTLAASKAYQWVSNRKVKPHLFDAIQEARSKTSAKLEVTRERVLAELAKIAFVDPRKFYAEDGSLKKVTDLDDDTAASLAGFEVEEINVAAGAEPLGRLTKVKWSDKKAALDSINRMMGWNQDKLKLQGDPEAPLEVKTKVVIVPQKQVATVQTKPLSESDD